MPPAPKHLGGRPKKEGPPSKVVTVRVDAEVYQWMYDHLSRRDPMGDFINEALKEKIATDPRSRRRCEEE